MAQAQRAKKMVRRSVTVPAEVDSRVRNVAERESRSASQVYQMVIEKGLAAQEAEKRHFFEVGERLQNATEPAEIKRLKEELARLTFGS